MDINALEATREGCKICGAALPKGRLVFCFACRPSRRKITPTPEPSEADYSLADRNAQARARRMTYGQYMACLHSGSKPLPRIRPVEWPDDSPHAGEEQITEGGG